MLIAQLPASWLGSEDFQNGKLASYDLAGAANLLGLCVATVAVSQSGGFAALGGPIGFMGTERPRVLKTREETAPYKWL